MKFLYLIHGIVLVKISMTSNIKWHGLINGTETTLYRKVVIPYGQNSGSEFALVLGLALGETLPKN